MKVTGLKKVKKHMKRVLTSITVFSIAYGTAYWWGVYDLKTHLPTIENDADLATLGMMPIFLHIYGIGCGIIALAGIGIYFFIKSRFRT